MSRLSRTCAFGVSSKAAHHSVSACYLKTCSYQKVDTHNIDYVYYWNILFSVKFCPCLKFYFPFLGILGWQPRDKEAMLVTKQLSV